MWNRMAARLIVCGAAGRMGRTLIGLIRDRPDAVLHAAVEAPGHAALGRDAGEVAGGTAVGVALTDDYEAALSVDSVTLDFTAPPATLAHLRAAVARGTAMVIGTTGYDAAERAELDRLAPQTRTVVAANMSAGVTVLLTLVEAAARALGPGFDAEIVEMHHRLKVDAPSGTALALARVLAAALGRDLARDARYGREGVVGARTDNEIGILALRGGDVIGDHTVILAGLGERLELTHRAQSRDCLARGALRAALWLPGQPPGRYSMADVLGLSSEC
jgi:4-hydroxy-tetrahydrodipicolinate reductase